MEPGMLPQPSSEERTWALVSHLGAVAGLVLGVGTLGWLAPLVIWLVKRESSPFVAFHALQSLLFQLMWLLILGAGFVLATVLTLVLIGLALFPLLAVAGFIPLVWSVIAGIKAANGEWYTYPAVGRFALQNVRF